MMLHPYHEAKKLADEFLRKTEKCFVKVEVAGSVRRRRPYVHDVDIVGIPVMSPPFEVSFPLARWIANNADAEAPEGTPETVKYVGRGEFVSPDRKSIRFFWHGIGFEVYVATPENFAIMWLVRTGPAEQNHALAVRAKKQGKKLAFSRGIEQGSTGRVLTFDTEEEVLNALWLPYVYPEMRDHEQWIALIKSGKRVKPGGHWAPGSQGDEAEIGKAVRSAERRQAMRDAMTPKQLRDTAAKNREELFGL